MKEREQQKPANGILWRLIKDEQFQLEQSKVEHTLILSNGQILNSTHKDDTVYVKVKDNGGHLVVLRKNLTKEQSEMIDAQTGGTSNLQIKTSKPYEYDLMISYSHDDYDLCNIIYNCLLKTGKYRIWFNKEKMHDPTMEQTAKAIEDSHIMLVCMSNAYRSNQACQTECQTAFTRKRGMIFLKVEPNYKPSGWLEFSLKRKEFIDITKQTFLSTFKDIIQQISAQRSETPDYGPMNIIVTTDVEAAVTNIFRAKDKANHIVASQSALVKSDQMSLSGDIHQSTSLPSLSNSNQIGSQTTISSTSLGKTAQSATTKHKNDNAKALLNPNTKVSNVVDYPHLNPLTTSRPSTAPSISNDKHLQKINLKLQQPISSSSVASSFTSLASTSDNQEKIMKEHCTPEELAKYYSPYFGSFSVSSDYDSSNDFVLGVRKSSISSLSDDELETNREAASDNIRSPSSSSLPMFSSFLPQKNEDTISLASINIDEIDNPVSQKTTMSVASYKKKPIDQWTQQDVMQFFEEKKLTNMLVLFRGKEINGKRLRELHTMNKSIPAEVLESQKQPLNSSPEKYISLADYKRLENELQKLLPSSTGSSVLSSNIKQSK